MEIDMKPPLVLFNVAMSKLLSDIKSTTSVRCVNMTLFAWTVTYFHDRPLARKICEKSPMHENLYVYGIYYSRLR